MYKKFLLGYVAMRPWLSLQPLMSNHEDLQNPNLFSPACQHVHFYSLSPVIINRSHFFTKSPLGFSYAW